MFLQLRASCTKSHILLSSSSLPLQPKFHGTCPICLRAFDVKRLFDRHMAMHEDRIKLDGDAKCPDCGQQVDDKRKLNEHYQVREKRKEQRQRVGLPLKR